MILIILCFININSHYQKAEMTCVEVIFVLFSEKTMSQHLIFYVVVLGLSEPDGVQGVMVGSG